MKAIKIVEKNKEAIEKAMCVANGRAQCRLASSSDVEVYIKKIEQRLEKLGLLKKLWPGMKFYIQPQAENLPKAYFEKGRPSATSFCIERWKSGWFFLGAGRDTFSKGIKIQLLSAFNDDQKSAIIGSAYEFLGRS